VSAAYLLDANALIALVLADHEHHPRAAAWAAKVDRIALCPIASRGCRLATFDHALVNVLPDDTELIR
jgi:hypothetical protein